jgi:single-stranded-DNA-specific exonuclease
MKKIWKKNEVDEGFLERLVSELEVSRVVARLLVNRGVSSLDEARRFLECDLKDLHDPNLLKGMSEGILRIKEAIERNERILIFGDFDVDGVTSTTILYKVLSALGGDVSYYFPNRLTEGYGLSEGAIDNAETESIDLIITVDCGITANKQVDYANAKGIDVIVIDHHEQIGEVPRAVSVIDPKQEGCEYPYKKLAAVGVVFKVIQALVDGLNVKFDVFSLLDFVCLGTVADIVPLNGENRILVKNGLRKLSNTKNVGLKALIEVSELENEEINSGHISFKLGPRINSSGRLGSADKVMRLFDTESLQEAEGIAEELDNQNKKRREMQQKIFDEVIQRIEAEVDLDRDNCIVLSGEGWHRGIIGIVASKVVEQYHRPTILIALESDGWGYGSGRSIPKFHLLNAMNFSKKWMGNYGGHSQAAGLSIRGENVDGLRRDINDYSKENLGPKDLIPVLKVDAKLDLCQVDFKLIEEVHQLFPYGFGNPRPVFYSEGLSLGEEPRVLKEKHIKLNIKRDGGFSIGAIGFGMGEFEAGLIENDGKIGIAYFPEINEWNGNVSIQLGLKDVKFGGELICYLVIDC